MQEIQFPLADLIATKTGVSPDTGWPNPSPFNLRFSQKKPSPELSAALSGSGVYLISYGTEVVYIGMYRPAKGKIVDDRWKRHLQTITGRGISIGFGGKTNPNRRRDLFLATVDATSLREAIQHACAFSQAARFKDTGFNTTPNRMRFASEKWATFGSAGSADVLQGFSFWLLRIRVPATQHDAQQEVKDIEKTVLLSLRPMCNDEYNHLQDCVHRPNNTVEMLSDAVRQAAHRRTGQDITHRIQLFT